MASPRLSAFRSEQILRQTVEPIFWLDRSLRLTWVNAAWERLTGYSAGQVLELSKNGNPSTDDRVGLELLASHQPPAQALAGQPACTLGWLASRDGERYSRVLDFWPFHNQSGELIGILGRVRSSEEPKPENLPEDQRLHEELVVLRQKLLRAHGIDSLVGQGHAHDRLSNQIRMAAMTNSPVLILGEPGTGKRTVATTIHQLGANRRQEIRFVEIEALPSELLHDALFDSIHPAQGDRDFINGDLHNSDSGASRRVATLAIGDILLLPRDFQASLAGWIERGTHERVIAMSVSDPDAALRDERLLPDLYYSLTPLVLRLLPLRERRDEILLLAQHFLERANRFQEPRRTGFTLDAQRALLEYDWPGNLFELERVVNHARRQGERALISASELPASVRGNLAGAFLPPPTPPLIKPLDELLTEIERRLIENALLKARRNKTRAADLLGISRPRLYRRMKELNLEEEEDVEDDLGAPPG